MKLRHPWRIVAVSAGTLIVAAVMIGYTAQGAIPPSTAGETTLDLHIPEEDLIIKPVASATATASPKRAATGLPPYSQPGISTAPANVRPVPAPQSNGGAPPGAGSYSGDRWTP